MSGSKFKNALVSVSDKTGIIEFIKPLAAQGMRVVSTGGTAKVLKEAGIPVVDISEQTQFPEVMDGRVKTLHPRVHMALLCRDEVAQDMELLQKEKLEPFDLVVGNLYPFAEALGKTSSVTQQLEYIDIGGPSFLRAAAKSYRRITVVCDPKDYNEILEKSELTEDDRRRYAGKVFAHTSCYDSMIADYLLEGRAEDEFSLAGQRQQTLRYGENPQQLGLWFKRVGAQQGLHRADTLQGKELSYNNLLDLEAASSMLRELEGPACVSVKHNNPCGVATGVSVEEAVEKSLKADPVSVFGGIVAISDEVNEAAAELLNHLFLECVIAPSYTDSAKLILSKKKNLRVLQWPQLMELSNGQQIKVISGGFLLQNSDRVEIWQDSWKMIGQAPDEAMKKQLILAWQVCAHLKSNAIALVGEYQTVGLGMGQVNRVDAVEQALKRWKTFHPQISNVVLASDAFFPFADSIELAHRSGIRWIIQPGGSVRDEEVIVKANELGVNMVLTGVRHFLH